MDGPPRRIAARLRTDPRGRRQHRPHRRPGRGTGRALPAPARAAPPGAPRTGGGAAHRAGGGDEAAALLHHRRPAVPAGRPASGCWPEIDKVHLVSGFRLWQPVPAPLRWLGRAWRLLVRVVLGLGLEPLPGWLGAPRAPLPAAVPGGVRPALAGRELCLPPLPARDLRAASRSSRRAISSTPEILAKANFLGCYLNDEVTVAYRPREGMVRERMWKGRLSRLRAGRTSARPHRRPNPSRRSRLSREALLAELRTSPAACGCLPEEAEQREKALLNELRKVRQCFDDVLRRRSPW